MGQQEQRTGLEVAVIGMAGRFPGARNIEEFWRNLQNGVESVSFFKDAELEEAGVDRQKIADPRYIKAYGYLENIEYFDASFFGYSPHDAVRLDPQIRLFLETAWEALERAGYHPEKGSEKIGVFAGGCLSIGWHVFLSAAMSQSSQNESLQYVLLSDKDFLAAQAAYKLNLKGPTYVLNTACSTSLVAVDLACKNLLFGACDIALAGGVSISTFEKNGFYHEEGMILAPDGHCRAFDELAQGTVFGNGLGIVVLKTLERALSDGDTIYAVIKATAVNNDGAGKAGFTAPSVEGEAEVIRSALKQAEVEAESIGYIEAHGTGTALGDPIEIEALTRAFQTDKKKFCRIGSVKTNVGHLNTAAGIAGLIKTVLSLYHKQIPASLHFSKPNPRIDFENSPFLVNRELWPWSQDGQPLRAGVSAFGFGGTNAHAVLEEAPPPVRLAAGRTGRLLILSGRTEAALKQQQENLAQWLQANPQADLADVAYTLQVGRKAFAYRMAIAADSMADAIAALAGWATGGGILQARASDRVHPVFLFLEQEPRMEAGRKWYRQEPLFQAALADGLDILQTLEPGDWKDLFEQAGSKAISGKEAVIREAAESLRFCLDYALGQYLMRLGIMPVALFGQGAGEFAAACLAGVFSLADGLKLVRSLNRFKQGKISRQALETETENLRCHKPQKAFPSHRSGKWIQPEEALDPHYWSAGRESPAEIRAGMEELWKDPYALFIGSGAEAVFTGLVRPPEGPENANRYADLFRDHGDQGLARLWVQGVDLKWEELYRNEKRRRILLPTYPFERQRYWPERKRPRVAAANVADLPERGEKVSQQPGGAIPAPVFDRPAGARPYVAPRNASERKLCELLEPLLGIKPIGIEDDFLELGGDSLQATLWIAQIHQALNHRFSIEEIFTQVTVKQLAERLTGKAQGGFQDIAAVPPAAAYAVSSSQKRIYLLRQFDPESTAYNMPEALLIEGELDRERVETTVRKLVQRHESLRTRFEMRDNRILQIIEEHIAFRLEYEEERGEGPRERLCGQKVRAFIRPFDLARAPLFRVKMVKLDAQEHLLLFDLHHIIGDGMSVEIITDEFLRLYAGQSLEPLRIQYKDFAAWQLGRLKKEELQIQEQYWLEEFSGEIPVLQMPTDYPRPKMQSFEGGELLFRLEPRPTAGLKQLAQANACTLYMVLLAAYGLFLAKYSGQEEIVIGSPIAGRNHAGTERLIGVFINTLALRVRVEQTTSIKEYLAQVKGKCLNAFACPDYPFEELVEKIEPLRDLGRNPLFDAMFVWQNMPRPHFRFGDWTIKPFHSEQTTVKMDLTLEATEAGEEIVCKLRYGKQLFEKETAERMARHMARILDQFAGDAPSIGEIDCLSPDERQQLVETFNATAADYGREQTIVDLFEEQARKNPDCPAVVCQGEVWSYGELNARADILAYMLHSKGVQPEDLVGVSVEPSLEMVAALWGVLKAGGGYLPIDPSWPEERIQYLLADSRATAFIPSKQNKGRFDFSGVITMDRAQKTKTRSLQNEKSGNLQRRAKAGNPAYVIYTSGSTGQPKGVQIEHASLVNYVHWFLSFTRLQAHTKSLLTSSCAFDLGYSVFYPSLAVGAELHLLKTEEYMSVETLLDYIQGQGIHYLKITPSFFEALAGHADFNAETLSSLKLLVFGGEPINVAHLEKVYALNKEILILNHYGPTETTIGAIARPVGPRDLVLFKRKPTLGKPIANTQVYILDKQSRLCPIGVAGEICIGGAGLARGYWNDDQRTANRFAENPFRPGERLYHTGDSGRWHTDGMIEFLGRLDQQVKIRGFRVELEEIEAVLRSHPQIAAAVVNAAEAPAGEKRLIGYVVLLKEQALDAKEIRRFLQSRLPYYMIPGTFVMLAALPLTANGKVNRKALPIPDPRGQAQAHSHYTPRTPLEQEVVRIWRDVLRVETIGMQDDFFELGGHSLRAMQILSRIHQVFQVELPLRLIFEVPSIAGLSEHIAAALQKKESLPRVPIRPAARDGRIPLSFAQERFWFLSQLEPNSGAYHVCVALHFNGPIDADLFKQSLAFLIERHEILRTGFQTLNGRVTQVVFTDLHVDVPVLHWQGVALGDARIHELFRQQAERPFDLERGPLFRVVLLCLEREEAILILVMHHIISDAWSMGLLTREISICYEALRTGESPHLPALALQYADFAVWQRQARSFIKQLDYWKEKLHNAPLTLDLPVDHPRPIIQSYRGALEKFILSRESFEQLERLSRNQGVTIFMTFLTVFKIWLHRYTGQEDVIVGIPISHRNRLELEDVLGCFLNTLVLRTDLSGNPCLRELLQRVKETSLGAYTHQDMPFEQLVEVLQPQRDLARTPLFQVMFIMMDAAAVDLQLGGLQGRPLDIDYATSRFDLTCYILPGKNGCEVRFEYNQDLFEAATIRRMLGHLEALLKTLPAHPGKKLSDFFMLDQAEQQLVAEWNRTQAEYPRDKCMHELFAEQAEQRPEATAVVYEDQALTYDQLNRKANQLAHHLRTLGIGPETLVGICVARSPEMLIGLLGILKAGGAYMPLDPNYPQDRIAFMLEDSGVKVLLTQSALSARFTVRGSRLSDPSSTPSFQSPAANDDSSPFRVICLDTEWKRIDEQSVQNPAGRANSENLAYVIYTSGSTGRPKGVMVAHRGVVNLLWSMFEALGMHATDSVLSLTNLTFDIAALELYLPLICGARTQLMDRITSSDPGVISETIVKLGITMVQATPATWRLLIETGWGGALNLKALCGGEVLSVDLSARLQARVGRLWNVYGPTETTIWSSIKQMEAASSNECGYEPIGRPLGNNCIFILDGNNRPVPIGAVGELYIGGVQVARGYLKRPELTAEKFIPDPFSGETDARLYKTGDLARWLPDGNIEYLGRADFQVKIRGFRIELGEIEAALSRHAQVRAAVVLAHEDVSGDKRLAAYIVPTDKDTPPDSAELRLHLKAGLPDYMVPTAYVLLEALPLTPNGKIDRKALPVPEYQAPSSIYVAPQTRTEEALAKLFSEVLGIERVGALDNFFELGGHSLLAMRLLEGMRRNGMQTDLRALFTTSTLSELATLVDHQIKVVEIPPNRIPDMDSYQTNSSKSEFRL